MKDYPSWLNGFGVVHAVRIEPHIVHEILASQLKREPTLREFSGAWESLRLNGVRPAAGPVELAIAEAIELHGRRLATLKGALSEVPSQ